MEEKKDKNQLKGILFIILYALVGTVILAFIILLVNCIWPTQNLFKAETWGTISDWFTYLVTLIGGVFIYKTLDSQLKVQKDQFEIKIIEKRRYFEEIKPYFTFFGSQSGEKIKIEISSSKRCIILKPCIVINNKMQEIINIKRTVPDDKIWFALIDKPENPENNIYPLHFEYIDVYGNKYFLSGQLAVVDADNIIFSITKDELIKESMHHTVYNKDIFEINW